MHLQRGARVAEESGQRHVVLCGVSKGSCDHLHTQQEKAPMLKSCAPAPLCVLATEEQRTQLCSAFDRPQRDRMEVDSLAEEKACSGADGF